LSLDAEQAHPPFGDRRAVERALAVTALTSAAASQPLPLSAVILSDDQMAKIKG